MRVTATATGSWIRGCRTGVAVLAIVAGFEVSARAQDPRSDAPLWIDVGVQAKTTLLPAAFDDAEAIDVIAINLASARIELVSDSEGDKLAVALNGSTRVPPGASRLALTIADVTFANSFVTAGALVLRPARESRPELFGADERALECIARIDAATGDAEAMRSAAKLLAVEIDLHRSALDRALTPAIAALHRVADATGRAFYRQVGHLNAGHAALRERDFATAWQEFGTYARLNNPVADDSTILDLFRRAVGELPLSDRTDVALDAIRWWIADCESRGAVDEALEARVDLGGFAVEQMGFAIAGDALDRAESVARSRGAFDAAASDELWDSALKIADLNFHADRAAHGFELLDQLQRSTPSMEREIRILGTRGNAFCSLGDYEGAAREFVRMESLLDAAAPPELIAQVDELAQKIDLLLGATESPRQSARAAADNASRPESLLNSALLAHLDGDDDAALDLYRTCFERATQRADQVLRAKAAIMAAAICIEIGDADEAVRWLELPLRATRGAGTLRQAALATAAIAYAEVGDHDAAARFGIEFDRQFSPRDSEWKTSVLEARATSALDRGDLAACELTLDELDALVDSMAAGRGMLTTTQTNGLRGRFASSGRMRQDLITARLSRAETPADRAAIAWSGWRAASSQRGRMLLDRIRTRATRPIPPLDEAMLAKLEPGEVVIEYVAGRHDTFAYVGRRGSTPRRVNVGPSVELSRDVRQFVGIVAEKTSSATEEQELALAHRLATALVVNVLDGEPAKILTFSTPPEWAQLPIEALALDVVGSGPNGVASWAKARLVIDDFETRSAPSISTALALRELPAPRTDMWLIAGDPQFGGGSATSTDAPPIFRQKRRADTLSGLPSLPQARAESMVLAKRAFRSRAGADADLPAELKVDDAVAANAPDIRLRADATALLTGEHATKAAVLDGLGRARLAHFGTHGFYERSTGIVGLAFAADGDDDGLLSPSEILDLDLDLDLAFLATCDGARGPALGSDGVHSVAHAMLCAGTRAVLAARWESGDVISANLTNDFYAAWLNGDVSASSALRTAKLGVRTSGTRGRPAQVDDSPAMALRREFPTAHPRFWAAIECYGTTRAGAAPKLDRR